MTSNATRDALAGLLFRTFSPMESSVIGWEELIRDQGETDPFVVEYRTAAAKLLDDEVFRVIAGATSFPAFIHYGGTNPVEMEIRRRLETDATIERIRAGIRALQPDEITPQGVRVLTSILDAEAAEGVVTDAPCGIRTDDD